MAGSPAGDQFSLDVVVIGGCGHVGLPLAIAFADRGARVGIYDVSDAAVATVNGGGLPFDEPGAAPLLERAVAAGRLRASVDPSVVGSAEHVVVVIGTPVDEHLNPDQQAIPIALGGCAPYLRDGQLLVLRSTVFPGVTALVEKMVAALGVQIEVAFCPERIAEGRDHLLHQRRDAGEDRGPQHQQLAVPQVWRAAAERNRDRLLIGIEVLVDRRADNDHHVLR